MQIAIPVFPRFTALDAVGPYEVLQRIPSIEVVFVGHQRGEVRMEDRDDTRGDQGQSDRREGA